MPTYEISVDLAPLAKALAVVGEQTSMRVSQAVATTARAGQILWQDEIMKANGLRTEEKQEYAQSVLAKSVDGTGANSFEAIIWSDYKYAEEIDSGRPARDLKQMLNTSTKVKISAKGTRYLSIPFRHGTPGTNINPMSQDVYEQAESLQGSTITDTKLRLSRLDAYDINSHQPFKVPQNVYQWGGRLGNMPNKNQSGMVRFDTSTGNAKSSVYLTFRTMSENSTGWIVPATPGLYIVQNVVNKLKPLFEQAIAKAVQLQLE